MTFSLFKILYSNMASFGEFIANFKKGPKGIAKNLLILILFLYCVGVFGFIYINTMVNLYNALEASGKTYIMPVSAMFIAFMITFFFGFLSVATNYCTGAGEEQLLSLPLTAKQIFSAKFWIAVVADSVFGVVLLAVASIIYGIKKGLFTKPGFYVGFLVSSLTLCVISIAVIFAALILVLTLIPSLRKKNFLQGIASFFVILFAAGGGMIGSMTGASIESETLDIGALIVNSSVGKVAETKAMQVFGNALAGNWLSILAMAAVCAVVIFGIVPLLAPLYIRTLNGFSDVKTKRIDSKEAEKMMKTEIKVNSVFKSLFYRDVKTVLREPAFFANGPLLVLILPVIMIVPIGFSLVSAGEGLKELGFAIRDFLHSDLYKTQGIYYISLALSGFIIFMGNGTSIASTSFSREGKSIYDLKALPVRNELIVLAKFAHAFVYIIVSNIIIDLIACVVFGVIGIADEIAVLTPCFLRILVLSSLVSLVLIFTEMFIDTANPKLNWENPIAAFKQNVNSIIAVFVTMTVTAIFVVLGVFLLPKNTIGFFIMCAIFLLIAAPLGTVYFKYATKRISTI